MRTLYIKYLLLLFTILSVCTSKAQTIDTIYNEFNIGNFRLVIDKYEKLPLTNKTNEWSAEDQDLLHKLLIVSYYKLDSNERALRMTEVFLKKYPNYVCENYVELEEFCSLLSSFDRSVKFILQANTNLFVTNYIIKNVYSIDQNGYYSQKYISQIGSGFSLKGILRINKSIGLNTSLGFINTTYDRNISLNSGELKFTERNSYYTSNLGVNWTFFEGLKIKSTSIRRLSFSLGAHYGIMYLGKAEAVFNYKYNVVANNSEVIENTISEPNYDLSNQRNSWIQNLGFNQEMRYTVNRVGFNISLTQVINFTDFNNAKFRWNDSRIMMDYFYVDNDFKGNYLGLEIGISYLFNYKFKR